MARLYGSRVTVLHVEPVGAAVAAVPVGAGYDAGAFLSIESDVTLRELSEFAGVSADERDRVDYRVSAGTAWRGIVEEAASARADLIVIGARGRSGLDRLLFGSVVDKVVRKASCPVLTVPAPARSACVQPRSGFTRILCAVDFSDASMAAFHAAADIAERSGATLLVMHVVEAPERDEALEAYRRTCTQRLREAVPARLRERCTAAAIVASGKAHEAIVRAAGAEFADLVVLGTHGGGPSRRPFGSTTEYVVRHATCAVLSLSD